MAVVDFSAIEQAIKRITDSIPGPQEGESVFEFRARIDDSLMKVVAALGERKTAFEGYIARISDDRLRPTDQYYNGARQKFIADEFGE